MTEKEEPRDFGWALRRLKAGHRVARAGWNGKHMFLYLAPAPEFWTPEGRKIRGKPSIVMRTAQGFDQIGWLASQPDMLEEDWEVAQ